MEIAWKASEEFISWRLVRGEHFLAYMGVHPKVLELFDHNRSICKNDDQEIWNNCTVGSGIPKGQKSIEYLRKMINECSVQISERIGGYASGHDYFVRQLASKLLSCAREAKNKKVIFRTTDFKSHDLTGLFGAKWFENADEPSYLGFRGLGRYLHPIYQELFKWELEACDALSKNTGGDFGIIFPCVRTPSELKQGLELVGRMGIMPLAIGMMVELEINVLMIEEFLEVLRNHTDQYQGSPILLIGLGDLTQSIMGASRTDPRYTEEIEIFFPVSGRKKIRVYNETDPAVFDALKHTLYVARKYGVECGIHIDILKSIGEENAKMAEVLIKNLKFYVTDYHLL